MSYFTHPGKAAYPPDAYAHTTIDLPTALWLQRKGWEEYVDTDLTVSWSRTFTYPVSPYKRSGVLILRMCLTQGLYYCYAPGLEQPEGYATAKAAYTAWRKEHKGIRWHTYTYLDWLKH